MASFDDLLAKKMSAQSFAQSISHLTMVGLCKSRTNLQSVEILLQIQNVADFARDGWWCQIKMSIAFFHIHILQKIRQKFKFD
ncbi:hypothetical protein LPB67_13235 [Undibacterium sp. Jales W-56]|uniref:hypothetical protein n=1 Tax=Undibacterium sp. Jales W-56 TaxID=2897325 RepID=UPI0021D0602E|nr:hypothetical protein [Undibacterium sp. Jales W-56]MCU6434735.1 hypothetical protein [Undibacterium sp. Jales W-56]